MASNSSAADDAMETISESIISEPDVKFYPEMAFVKSMTDDDCTAENQQASVTMPAWTEMDTETETDPGDIIHMKEFIMRLESLQELWDPLHQNYSNKYKRVQNLSKLLPIIRKFKPKATLEDVKRKINTLRSNYRRELRRVALAIQNGKRYCPKLWYFPYLKFLQTLEKNTKLFDNKTTMEQETIKTETSVEENDVLSPSLEVQTYQTSSPEPLAKRFKTYHNTSELVYQNLTNVINGHGQSYNYVNNPNISKTDPLENNSTFEFKQTQPNYLSNCMNNEIVVLDHNPLKNNPIALEWATIVDRLDPTQRLHAKKAINDILYEAELGNLNRNSVKINENQIGSPTSM